jgi:hypothetical protein
MRHIAGYDRSQTLLLPESLDEYVGPENPLRSLLLTALIRVPSCQKSHPKPRKPLPCHTRQRGAPMGGPPAARVLLLLSGAGRDRA